MIKLTWFGTATVLLDIDGEKLLFDPFFRMNKKLPKPELKEFCDVDYIFNTHPHFDHLCDVPLILKNSKARFFGTPTAYLRLETQGVDVDNRVEILCPHDKITTKKAEIVLHRTFHVKNDVFIVLKTALKIIFKFQFKKALQILKTHKQFLMGGDIVAFEVRAQGKKILIFGSAGFDKRANLPDDVDVLVWPFQGRIFMTRYSLPIVKQIAPKKIVLSHFDNAFPPITGHVNTKKFLRVMKRKMPDIETIEPTYKKSIKI